MNEKKNVNIIIILSVIVILLLLVIGEIYYFGNKTELNSLNQKIEKNDNLSTTKEKTKVTVITDARCGSKCNVNPLVENLKQIPSLLNAEIKVLDYSEKDVKKILKESNIKRLPAVLFSNNNISEISKFLIITPNDLYSLDIGATFDPTEEICGNDIDDNNNGKTDCEDSFCSKTLSCAPKVKKPKAELFIMSYCPYGTQAQKGYLSVIKNLGKVADVEIKYVNYLMHGEKEGDENIKQNCIQKEQKEKFTDYLECFLKEGKSKECTKTVKLNKNKLSSCIKKTKKEIKYTENIVNKVGRFPKFLLNNSENIKYGVQASPTFVLNGVKVKNVGRDAKSYANFICNSFKVKPKECEKEFLDTVYDPNFGFTSNGKVVSGGCGK